LCKARAAAILLAASAFCSGCSDVDTSYGSVSGESINGTGTLAGAFRQRGEVRVTRRLNDEVAEWAQTIVRFAPYPGPPSEEEAAWYDEWLETAPGRQLIYVVRDFSAAAEYWDTILAELPPDGPSATRERYQRAKARSTSGPFIPLVGAKKVADPEDWFALEGDRPESTCKKLTGPWSAGLDTKVAAIPRHQTFKKGAERPLLECDGKPLVIWWSPSKGSRVLAIANASFLLNEPLTRKPRQALAMRVLDWVGPRAGRTVFVEGHSPAADHSPPGLFDILFVDPIGWIGGHVIALGLIGGLAMAVRLGRPRGAPPSGADRPVAHAEALGELLARTSDLPSAQRQIDQYRRWRQQIAPSKTRGTNPFERA
jgi:hypothetical protein